MWTSEEGLGAVKVGLLDRDAPEDQILTTMDLPPLVQILARALVGGLAVLGIGGSLLLDDGNDWVNVGGTLLCFVTLLPWIAGRDVGPDDWHILGGSLVATAALAIPDWANGDASLGSGPQWTTLLPLVLPLIFVLVSRRVMSLLLVTMWFVVVVRTAASPEPLTNFSAWSVPLMLVTAGVVGIRRGAVEIARAQRSVAAFDAEEDRRRVSREVHAAVAHTLTVTLLHVATARTAIRRARSDDAVTALEEAERHGRSSLADVRRVIRLLRSDDDTALAKAQPGLADVAGLVADYRDAGWPVDLVTDGDLESVSPSAGLAVYRVLQEALTNAAQHGTGRAQVEIRVGNGSLDAHVSNPVGRHSPAARHGAGIVRMRERTEAAGGELRIEQTSGTWEVRAHLACDGTAVR